MPVSGNRRKKVDPRRAPRLSQLQAFVVAVETLSKTSPQEAIQVPANSFSLLRSLTLSLSPLYSFFRTDFWRIVLYALLAFDIKDNTLIHPLPPPLPLPQAYVFRGPRDPSAAYTARRIHQYSRAFSASGVSSSINYYILSKCRPTTNPAFPCPHTTSSTSTCYKYGANPYTYRACGANNQ